MFIEIGPNLKECLIEYFYYYKKDFLDVFCFITQLIKNKLEDSIVLLEAEKS